MRRSASPIFAWWASSSSVLRPSSERKAGRIGSRVCTIKAQRLAIVSVFWIASGISAKSSVISAAVLKRYSALWTGLSSWEIRRLEAMQVNTFCGICMAASSKWLSFVATKGRPVSSASFSKAGSATLSSTWPWRCNSIYILSFMKADKLSRRSCANFNWFWAQALPIKPDIAPPVSRISPSWRLASSSVGMLASSPPSAAISASDMRYDKLI